MPRRDKALSLSKSRYCSGLQCHLRLWRETHERDSMELVVDAALQRIFDTGTQVGALARSYVPGGVLIDDTLRSRSQRVAATKRALAEGARVIYEAAFFEDGVFVAVDILSAQVDGWTLTEVKSTTQVKEAHLPDASVQTYVLRKAGLEVRRVELMHLNRECRFPDLSNLFVRADISQDVEDLLAEVPDQIRLQLAVLAGPEPEVETGPHCTAPYECPYLQRCAGEPIEHAITTLYRLSGAQRDKLSELGYSTLHDMPLDAVTTAIRKRQLRAVQSGRAVVERGLTAALGAITSPVAYLDFETIAPAIPRWDGCRPYDQVVVQMSCHVEHGGKELKHFEWLAEGTADPRPAAAEAIVAATKGAASIVTYNVGFERSRIRELREAVPRLSAELEEVESRLRDLLPIVRDHVYHPDFAGSFSIKSVLPALVPSMGYEGLEVADGSTASAKLESYLFDEQLAAAERSSLRDDLLAYCKLDTLAMHALCGALAALSGAGARKSPSARARGRAPASPRR